MSYKEKKANARWKAMEIMDEIQEAPLSYAELLERHCILERLAKNYGLTREFRENAMI